MTKQTNLERLMARPDIDDLINETRNDPLYLDFPWYENDIDLFREVAAHMGLHIGKDDVEWTGFWSQGDGARFNASWEMPMNPIVTTIRSEYPNEPELIRIAYELWDAQRRNFYSLRFDKIGFIGNHYYHSGTMYTLDGFERDISGKWFNDGVAHDKYHDQVRGALRDLADWLYKQLEAEYDYYMSDEAILDYLADENVVCYRRDYAA